MAKTVLVAGASGALGQHTVRPLLRLGHWLHPRLCELFEFVIAVSLHECVARALGRQSLSAYLQAQAAGRST